MKGYYKELIVERIDKQIAKGEKKYGVVLENNTQDMSGRLDHLAEELVDALQYIEHIKVQDKARQHQKTTLVELVSQMILLSAGIKDDTMRENMITCIRAINDIAKNLK